MLFAQEEETSNTTSLRTWIKLKKNKNNICNSTLSRSTLEDVSLITGFQPGCERDFFVRIGSHHKGILICKRLGGRNELNIRQFIPVDNVWKTTIKGITLDVSEWISLKEQLAAIDCGLSLLDNECYDHSYRIGSHTEA